MPFHTIEFKCKCPRLMWFVSVCASVHARVCVHVCTRVHACTCVRVYLCVHACILVLQPRTVFLKDPEPSL